MPLFAQADLYIDFKESPEGPRGVNLLKSMCGMKGVPLVPEAVVMAEKVDQDTQRILVAINGAIEAGNRRTGHRGIPPTADAVLTRVIF